MHECQFKIRSTQVDSFGHLNHAAYLEIFEWARWEWLLERGIRPQDDLLGKGLGLAVVRVETDFTKEVRMLEQVTVRSWGEKVEKIKFLLGQEMLNAAGQRVCRQILTAVAIDLKARKAVPIPEALRAVFEQDLPGLPQLP